MSPQLLVTDIDQSVDFYTNKLGFDIDFRYNDFYVGIIKDGHSVHLKSDVSFGRIKDNDKLNILFSVDGIKELYELLRKSVETVQVLRDMPYGREFYVADPDGNVLAFIET
jgi:catechol 2,3-dioxygenase-like lactoylglutathione lyase family enzyme